MENGGDFKMTYYLKQLRKMDKKELRKEKRKLEKIRKRAKKEKDYTKVLICDTKISDIDLTLSERKDYRLKKRLG